MDSITDYDNQTTKPFWTSYSIDDERFETYQVDGVLVSLSWLHEGQQYYKPRLAVVAKFTGASIEILRLEIKNIGVLPFQQVGEVKIDKKVKDRDLYRIDPWIAVKIETEKLKQLAMTNDGKFEAILTVRVNKNGNITEKEITYIFKEKVRKYIPWPT